MNKKNALLLLMPILLSGCALPFIVTGGAAVVTVPLKDKGVSGTINDAQIASIIGARLHKKNSKSFTQVDIDVQMGEVLLTGFDDVEMSVEAEKIAWKVEGVKAVYNHIQNCPECSLLDYTKDGWITTKIKSQFTTSDYIKSLNYFVKTVGGTVFLMGISQDETEYKEVHDIARKTKGVKKVVTYVKKKANLKKASE